ncbi:hypothetical protein [Phenylobacterium sp.]|uniref:hypothetical protein n=1 Tax=Phenylobacterium sp. TaxID=1871053 RepID=UPI003568CEA2
MSYSIPHWVWDAVVVAVAAAALWKGGRDERLAGSGMLLAAILSKLLYQHAQATEWGILATDAAALALFVWIALTSARWWPLFVAAFQFLAIVIHLARIVDRSLGGWAYISAEILFGYLVAIGIALGTYNTWRALRARAVPATDPGATRR